MLSIKTLPRMMALATLLFSVSLLGGAQTAAPAKQTKTQVRTQTTTKKKVEGTAATQTAGSQTDPVDINTATKEQLEALPAIGTTYSQKIIDNRPYKRKDELVSKKVIPTATFQKIRSKIIAKQ